MGWLDDKMTVDDEELKVLGFGNLRVVDGSTFPEPVGDNINAAIIIAAEPCGGSDPWQTDADAGARRIG